MHFSDVHFLRRNSCTLKKLGYPDFPDCRKFTRLVWSPNSHSFSFFLSWGLKTQLPHWTKRVVRTRLLTYDPRNCPFRDHPIIADMLTGKHSSQCLWGWRIRVKKR